MEQDKARQTPSVPRDSAVGQPGYALLTTKLNVPSVRTNLVTRRRLMRHLDEGIGAKLTLVCAPAGFGKTTLLGDWILGSGLPAGWLSLDEDDNDATRFLAYLVAAIETATTDIGESVRSLLESPQPPTRAVLTDLVNEVAAIPTDFAIILDDYHLVEDEAVHSTLAFLLEHLPPRMHLVIASRTKPPLPLSRLLAGGNLTKLTASELRFTFEEAADFLGEAMGLDLPAQHVAALEERTEGWIAGLQLAALSMRGREDISGFVSAFAGTDRHVFDYLAEEVLDRQSAETRAFLLRTSILERLSGPLCDAVTDREQGQLMLEKLERGNLLMVPLDDRRHWYRYHHLFRDFLRQRLYRESPEMGPELHRRASAWHEANGTASEAIGHSLAARDFERAAGMIEQLADVMMGRGDFPTLERLLTTLPEEMIRTRPHLYMHYVVAVVMTGNRWDDAEPALRDIERMLGLSGEGRPEPSETGSAAGIVDDKLRRDAGFVATARANIAYEGHGDLERAISLNRLALELFSGNEENYSPVIAANNLVECLLDIGDLPAAEAAIDESMEISGVTGHPAVLAWTFLHRGRLLTIQARLSEAMKTYEQLLRLSTDHHEANLLLDTGVAHVRIGELLFEWNDLEAAGRRLSLGIEQAREWIDQGEATSRLLEVPITQERLGWLESVEADPAHAVLPGYITLARVRQTQGDTGGALEALRKVERVAQNARLSPLWKDRAESWGEAWQARLWIAEGNLRAANRWAQGRELRSTDEIDYSSELEYTTLARLLLAQGKHEEAANLLGRLLEASESGGRRHAMIELLVLQTLVLRARNDQSGALSTLRRVLTLAEPEGYVRTFADEGEPMADLLKRLLKSWRIEPPNDFPLEYAGRLLEALGAGTTVPASSALHGSKGPILDPMTERELEVLRLLNSDLSNREISARLFVSLDTVKSHTRHIYAKLGVHNRHQAVAKARDLELL